MVTWPLFGTLQGPIYAKCQVRLSKTSKRHNFSLGFQSVSLVWSKTYPVGCAVCRIVEGYPKNAENAVFGYGSDHATKFRNFSRWHPSPPLWRFAAEISAIRRLSIYNLGCVTSITKKHSRFVELPTRRPRSKSAHKCIPYNNRCAKFYPNWLRFGSTRAKLKLGALRDVEHMPRKLITHEAL